MLRLTLTQMRASAGRLVAAGLAIVLGTAFVAASLMAGAVMERTTHDAVTARYADADLVLSGTISADQLEQVRAADGVAAAASTQTASVELEHGTRSQYVGLGASASDERLRSETLTDGDLPTGTGQIAVAEDVAERLGLSVGDELTVVQEQWTDDPDAGPTTQETTAQVVGLIASPTLYLFAPTEAVVTPGDLADIRAFTAPEEAGTSYEAMVAVQQGADPQTVASELSSITDGTAQVQTVNEVAEEQTAAITGDSATMVALLLAFAAVALIVAALVIANTFQVLVAQRTRTLALLRCVGADRRQVHTSVLTEAAILGLVSSLVGVGLGTGLMALGLRVLAQSTSDLPLSTDLVITPTAVVVPLLTGLLVTVAAALLPARLATRVAPLAALRPADAPAGARASKVRIVVATVAVLGGAGLLALGVLLARGGDSAANLLLGLGVGMLGGLVSLFGLLLGCVLVVPALIRLAGRLLGRSVPARVAVANAVRNPRRTAATASALVIGVTLVTMMSTGALAANRALTSELASSFPVDLEVSTATALPDEQIQAVTGTDGVQDTVLLSRTTASTELADLGETQLDVAAAQEGDLAAVVRSTEAIAGLAEDSIVVGHQLAESYDLHSGDQVTLTGPSDQEVPLTVAVSSLDGRTTLVAPQVLTELDPDAPVAMLWARVADDDAYGTVTTVQTNLTENAQVQADAETPQVSGAAVERSAFQQVVNTMLAVVVGLLAVSVVIALIGVANTLSLSVIERRRESAMLRALGLTRGQLRAMLGIEGLMIAGAGALIGVVAGLVYGWAGSAIILAGMADVDLVVPWRDLGLVALVALAAGLLASALPARTAARTSPAAALAVD
ncbi:ABC transporter permease [Ruania albidiflava]|uniref:ABC transporter permease n=1 Tax=Ruania albidiflava TaxID=366586 RepID=UPI0003B35074|nr:ABC transporter permease [Ruania albidiflava]